MFFYKYFIYCINSFNTTELVLLSSFSNDELWHEHQGRVEKISKDSDLVYSTTEVREVKKNELNRWGNSGNSVRLYFGGAPKSLQMVITAMKLKDAYSLEEKLGPT